MKTRTVPALLLALLLSASLPARASDEPETPRAEGPRPWRIALVVGAGHAYDLLGTHLEVRHSRWAAFAGTGLMMRLGLSGVFGFKGFSGQGEGFVGSLHLSYTSVDGYDSRVGGLRALASLSATVGWRFRWEHSFLELGIGPSFGYERMGGVDDSQGGRVVDTHRFGFGALGPESTGAQRFFPDLALALGYEF